MVIKSPGAEPARPRSAFDERVRDRRRYYGDDEAEAEPDEPVHSSDRFELLHRMPYFRLHRRRRGRHYGLAHIGGMRLGAADASVTGHVLPLDSTSNLCGTGSLKVGLTNAQR